MKKLLGRVALTGLLGLSLTTCADVDPNVPVITNETDCNDGEDEDNDGDRDCRDSDCAGTPQCAEACDNAQDDDLDGNFDCADPDCAGAPECAEDCTNLNDDDFDGLIDCDDSDCAQEAVCLTCDPAADDCSGEEICIVDACQPAFGRVYRFSGFQLSLGTRDRNNGCWDSSCSDTSPDKPDPKVELFLNGTRFLETSTKSNVFNATYSEAVTINIPAGSRFTVQVLDVDDNADDLAIACTNDPLEADLLRGRALVCQNTVNGIDVGSISFNIKPNGE
jgi:hypothetical protein